MKFFHYSVNQVILSVKLSSSNTLDYSFLKNKFSGWQEYRGKISYSSPEYVIIITRNSFIKIHLKNFNLHHNLVNISSLVTNLLGKCCSLKQLPSECRVHVENVQCTFKLFLKYTFVNFISTICQRFEDLYDIFLRSSLSPETGWIQYKSSHPQISLVISTSKYLKLKEKKTGSIIQIRYNFGGSCIVKKSDYFLDFLVRVRKLLLN